MDVPVARRAERPTWINRRTVLGVTLFVVAVLTGQRALESARVTVPVWTATRDLPRHATLEASDLRIIGVRLPDEVLSVYATSSFELSGAVTNRPLRAGELIALDWVTPAGTPGRAMTIPVAPEHAVGGALRAGDRIDVLATFDAGDLRARTVVLARDLEIQDVVTAGGVVVGEETAVGITVSVTPEEAGRLAFAIRTAELDIVRIDGDSASVSEPATIRGSDFR